jgi:hypothetical protein
LIPPEFDGPHTQARPYKTYIPIVRVSDSVAAGLHVGPAVIVEPNPGIAQNVKRRMLTLIITPMANIMEARDDPP